MLLKMLLNCTTYFNGLEKKTGKKSWYLKVMAIKKNPLKALLKYSMIKRAFKIKKKNNDTENTMNLHWFYLYLFKGT